jgi:hypothetical protein
MSASSELGARELTQANLFCIPLHPGAVAGEGDPLEAYDFALAGEYRRYIRQLISDNPTLAAHFRQPGPFLVAFRLPVGEVHREDRGRHPRPDSPNDVLLIDMTGAPREVIPVYVNSFKDAVRKEGISTDVALTPLRARFVAAVVRLDHALPLIEEAYAGAVKSFASSGGEPAHAPR